eukprot:CAMPEP_0113885234 /NCGR_PEP_ID=MMETSP0780_2-20120614/10783_1 /TAXON_ID=652834 /ORGANISM="Palpitomonas bilix" /LENGTH=346 /DNA_ID=CAMNT_0000873109 /DNA_START=89 /DNA_END=1130 /DNA_ORIENTATION=+ /assembly_acc=CAM_ASM_000599
MAAVQDLHAANKAEDTVLDEAARASGLTKDEKEKMESRLSIGETWHPLEICLFLRAANDHDLYASDDPKGVFDRSMEDVRATLNVVLDNPRELDQEMVNMVRRVAHSASKRSFEQFKLRLQNLRKRQCRSESGFLLRNAYISSLLSAIRIGRLTLAEIDAEFSRWRDDSDIDLKDIENVGNEDVYSLVRRSFHWSSAVVGKAHLNRDERLRKEISEDPGDDDLREAKRRKSSSIRRRVSNDVELVELPTTELDDVVDESEEHGGHMVVTQRQHHEQLQERIPDDREIRRLRVAALSAEISMMKEITRYYQNLNESAAAKERGNSGRASPARGPPQPIPFAPSAAGY